jgi:hypothetical protein
MIPLSLAAIAEITGATADQVPDPAVTVTGPVVIDSRESGPGALFAAPRGPPGPRPSWPAARRASPPSSFPTFPPRSGGSRGMWSTRCPA